MPLDLGPPIDNGRGVKWSATSWRRCFGGPCSDPGAEHSVFRSAFVGRRLRRFHFVGLLGLVSQAARLWLWRELALEPENPHRPSYVYPQAPQAGARLALRWFVTACERPPFVSWGSDVVSVSALCWPFAISKQRFRRLLHSFAPVFDRPPPGPGADSVTSGGAPGDVIRSIDRESGFPLTGHLVGRQTWRVVPDATAEEKAAQVRFFSAHKRLRLTRRRFPVFEDEAQRGGTAQPT